MISTLAEFDALPGSEDTKALAAWFVRSFDLPHRGHYGFTWGISLPAKKNGDQLAVNVGPIRAFYVEYFDDGWWCFLSVPKSEAVQSIVLDSSIGLCLGPGQTSVSDLEYSSVVGRPENVATLLRDPLVFAECEAFHKTLLTYDLPKPDRADDVVTEFVLGAPVSELRERKSALEDKPNRFSYGTNLEATPEDALCWKLANALHARGLVAVEPEADDADWHLAWCVHDSWTLVNSVCLLDEDEEGQLRIALGSTLRHYQLYPDRPPALVVLVDRKPSDASWFDLFADYGISLVEPSQLDMLLNASPGPLDCEYPD